MVFKLGPNQLGWFYHLAFLD